MDTGTEFTTTQAEPIARRQSGATLLAIAYLSLGGIGLYDGLLGVAWPSMWRTFQVSLDSMGLILAAGTLGFFLASVNSGRILPRIGVGAFVLIGNILRAAGIMGVALSPTWWGVILAACVSGVGNGIIDNGLNNYIATHHNPSRMNWLHASYGIGTTVSPLLMTMLLEAGQVWRWGYVIVGVVQGALALYVALTLRQWPGRSEPLGADPASAGRVSSRATLRILAVWLSIGVFFIYTGTEVTAGQWTYTLFTQARAVAASTAGFWVSVYWGSFTLGRFLLGFVVDHLEETALLRTSMIGAVVGAALIWWNPAALIGFLGLALLGLSLASIFPAMVSATPRRLGAGHTANAIGFQFGAASLGAAGLPGLAGLLAEHLGLEIIGPFMVLATALMFVLHETILLRIARHPQQA